MKAQAFQLYCRKPEKRAIKSGRLELRDTELNSQGNASSSGVKKWQFWLLDISIQTGLHKFCGMSNNVDYH